MIVDTYHRVHNYLRISLTDNCNLRCFYCMPQEEYAFTPASQLMQAYEIEAIAKTFVHLGVNKIRLTGGEPLVRKDAADIIERLGQLPVKLTLTTNATRLHQFTEVLQKAGITSINISLDTLHADKFMVMTRRNLFSTVMQNIEKAIGLGFHVKVNVVVTKGLNEDELLPFVAWTKLAPVHVRFIEFMPFTGNRWQAQKVVTWQQMLQLIGAEYDIIPLQRQHHDTAKAYTIPGHMGSFAVISTMSAPFCADCNRMRLTADGKLKNCLFSNTEIDLLQAFRSGQSLEPLITQSISQKAQALGGQFTAAHLEQVNAAHIENRSMITIGG